MTTTTAQRRLFTQGNSGVPSLGAKPLVVRIASLAFAALAYVGFLAAFTYCVGFVHRLVVPKGIDDGGIGSTWVAILVNVFLLAAFAIQHTIMARPAFKKRFAGMAATGTERSAFVFAASALLGVIMWQWRPLPDIVWSVRTEWVRSAMTALSLAGFGLVVLASFQIDHFHLFGWKQTLAAWRGRAQPEPEFHLRGLYRYVRHPLMTGFLIAFWCVPTMSEGLLLFASVITLYILIGTRIEERDLVRAHGDDYLAYRRSVPSLIPWRGRAA